MGPPTSVFDDAKRRAFLEVLRVPCIEHRVDHELVQLRSVPAYQIKADITHDVLVFFCNRCMLMVDINGKRVR